MTTLAVSWLLILYTRNGVEIVPHTFQLLESCTSVGMHIYNTDYHNRRRIEHYECLALR